MVTCDLSKTYAALPRTERGQFIVLGSDPKGKNVLYANGNSVIIRNIEDASENDIYTQHSARVSVAKYSPSGYYIASGDANGKIRIWDTTQKEHILKAEYQPFAGRVCDISWSADNSKIAIGGQGREKFGAVINIETGTNVGEVSGMSKCVNNLDLKPTRPFRLATSSEDGVVAFLEGPPFKFKTNHQCHTNFANCLRYSPTGEIFVSAGADGKIFMFDGKNGEQVGEVGDPAHKGGIYSVTFSSDGNFLFSAGGDKSIKVWAIDGANHSSKLVRQHVFGNHIDNIQVGCVCVGNKLVCASLSGELNIFNVDNLTQLDGGDDSVGGSRVQGHQKPLTSLEWCSELNRLISADSEGRVLVWCDDNGVGEQLAVGHTSQVQSVSINGNTLVTVGVDDKLIISNLANCDESKQMMKLTSQPRQISTSSNSNVTAVACYKEIVLTNGVNTLFSLPVNYEPISIAISPSGQLLVVGGEQNNKIFVYRVSNDNQGLTLLNEQELGGTARDLCFSKDGNLLVCGDSDRKVSLFTVNESANGDEVLSNKHNEHWKYHTARVSCVSISPDSTLVASGSLDCSIIVWSIDKPSNKFIAKNAHPMSNIVALAWSDNNTLFSAGQDSNIKKWNVKLQ